VRIPWDGRSPRDLTVARKLFIFKAQAGKKRERFAFGDQLELWPELAEGGPAYGGAPLLLPLQETSNEEFE